jgi:hypothetical protein
MKASGYTVAHLVLGWFGGSTDGVGDSGTLGVAGGVSGGAPREYEHTV